MNFSTNVMTESVDELLDSEGEVMIGNLTFYRSDILKGCDPIAYQCTVNDYIDSQIEDLQYDLDLVDEGDEDEIADLTARIEELESYYI